MEKPASAATVSIVSDRSLMRFLKTDGAALSVMALATIFFYLPVLSLQGPIWNDFIEQYYPYRVFATRSLRHLIFPFWNPYSFSGMPFFADIQSAVLYPLNILMVLFSGTGILSPVVYEYQIIAHIFLAGIFTYLLARDFNRSRTGALLAALVFMLGGFTTTHIFHITMIHALPWFPCALLTLRRALQRSNVRYALATGLILSFTAFAGHPQMYVYIHYLLGAYLIYHLIDIFRASRNFKKTLFAVALFTLAVGTGGGIASVQLIPTSKLSKESLRPEMEYSLSAQGSFRPFRFITLFAPNYYSTANNCRKNVPFYWGLSLKDVDPGPHYYWETSLYLGVLPLFLALLALILLRSPPVLFLGITAAGALLIAMGDATPVYKMAYMLVPGIKLFRNPARIGIIFTLVMALLAAFSTDWVLTETPALEKKQRKKAAVFCGIAAALVLLFAVVFASGAFRESIVEFIMKNDRHGISARQVSAFVTQSAYPYAVAQIMIFTVLALATIGLVAGRIFTGLPKRAFSILFPAVVFIDVLVFGYGFAIMKMNPETIYASNPLIRSVREKYADELFRINSRGSLPGSEDIGGPHLLFRRNEGTVHELFLMEGYNPLRLKRQLMDRNAHTLDVCNVKYKIKVDDRTGALDIVPHPTYLPRARMVSSYRLISNEKAILPLLHDEHFDHVNTVLLEEQPEGIPPGSRGTVNSSARIVSYRINRIITEVETDQPSLLVLSEVYYPAWKATIDGKPSKVLRADYALRAIAVPAGRHRVICYYEDETFFKGLLLSIFTLTTAIGVFIFITVRKRKSGLA